MKVLLVIDLQKDFCPGGALAVSEGDQIVPLVNKLMRSGEYDLVAASQDWHPADHGSFAANHPGKNVFEDIVLNGLPQKLWPTHCVQQSVGAEFHSDLDVALIDKVIQKGPDPTVDSYSAFADNGGRNPTELAAFLREQQTRFGGELEIDVVGLAFDYCVKFSAIDAARLGHKVAVILDGTRAVDQSPDAVAGVIRELALSGVDVIPSTDRLAVQAVALNPRAAQERGMHP